MSENNRKQSQPPEATEASNPSPPSLPPPEKRERLYRPIDWWAFAATTLIVLIGYLLTVAPDLTLEDSGELAVGSYYAGVPHPPGYPVWTIYSWMFTWLLPFSNVAWRVAVSSAVAGAFSAGLLSLMVSRGSSMIIESIEEFRNIERKWENAICIVSGFVAGMMLGFNGFMWSQSVIVEVYTLSVLSLVTTLALLLRWIYRPEQRRYLYLAFFMFGVCFTNHQTLIVAAMGIEVLIAMIRPKLGRDLFLMNSIVFILGLVAKTAGAVTAFTENAALFRIYLVVGVGSIIAWACLAYNTMEIDDWMVLAEDVLFTLSAGYLVLLIFIAGGVLTDLPKPALVVTHLVGICALGGFVYLTWTPPKGPLPPRLEMTRIFLLCLVGIYIMCLAKSPHWLNRGAPTFISINILGLLAAVALGVTIMKCHPYGKLFFPIFAMGGLWLLGVSFYFYLPIASMTNPPMNWAYPREVGGFYHALTRGQYEGPSPTDSFGRLIDQIVNLFLEGAREEFTLMFLCVGLIAFFFITRMRKRERAWIVGLSSIFICLSLLLLMLLNPNTDQQSKDLTKVFFTASHLIIAMGIGYGLTLIAAAIATQYERYRYFILIGACIAAGVALLEMATKIETNKYTLVRFAYVFVLLLAVAFVAVIFLFKEDAPVKPVLIASLSIFALSPVYSIAAHWADNEQRGHLFGFWFGHDMFKPPFDIYEPMAKDAILFGGTDPGRFCPTYMIFCESFIDPEDRRDPDFNRRDVYIITQNALADSTYLEYIRAHYNRSTQIDEPFFQNLFRSKQERIDNVRTNVIARAMEPLDRFFTRMGANIEARRRANGVYPAEEIHIPTPEAAARAFDEYYAEAFKRYQSGQNLPGEIIVPGPDGSATVKGQTAVMNINAKLAKIIFDKNPDHEFYLEESFPLEWMKPYLSPYGIIMKLNRRPLEELTPEMLERDHRFWKEYSKRLIGDWIGYDTPLKEVVDFALKTFGQRDFSGFAGDFKFARDSQAQKSFSKLRSSIAGLYDWRWQHAQTDEERERMRREAEFAYKQALAFYPTSPEAVANYSQLLASTGRIDDAIYLCRSALAVDPNNIMLPDLLRQLQNYRQANPTVTEQTYQGLIDQARALETNLQDNPLNITNALALVSTYYQLGQTNKAMQVLDTMITNTNAGPDVILNIANTLSHLGDLPRLEKALSRLVEVMPDSPEAWYDLSAIQAVTGQANPAIQSLKKSLELNDARLQSDPSADDLRDVLAKDTRFLGLKELPAYKREIPIQ